MNIIKKHYNTYGKISGYTLSNGMQTTYIEKDDLKDNVRQNKIKLDNATLT